MNQQITEEEYPTRILVRESIAVVWPKQQYRLHLLKYVIPRIICAPRWRKLSVSARNTQTFKTCATNGLRVVWKFALVCVASKTKKTTCGVCLLSFWNSDGSNAVAFISNIATYCSIFRRCCHFLFFFGESWWCSYMYIFAFFPEKSRAILENATCCVYVLCISEGLHSESRSNKFTNSIYSFANPLHSHAVMAYGPGPEVAYPSISITLAAIFRQTLLRNTRRSSESFCQI